MTDLPPPPTDPTPDVKPVPRSAVERLNRSVVILIVMTMAFGGLLVWFVVDRQNVDDAQDATDEHLTATDARLEETADALEALVAAEGRDDEEEAASACVRSHIVAAALAHLLTKLGEASADLDDGEVADLIATYPAPTCDRAAAQAVLDAES